MSLIHFFECRRCPGKTCHMQIQSEDGVAVYGGAICGTSEYSRTQCWDLVETREVSDDVE